MRPVLSIAKLRGDSPAVAKHDLSCIGQKHASADVVEQFVPEHVLELLHLHRYRGLGEVELFRCARVAEATRHGFEDLGADGK